MNRLRVSLVIPTVVIFSIAFYIAMDSIFLRAFPAQRAVYAVMVLIAVSAAISGLGQLVLSMKELLLLTVWILLNALWLLMVAGHERVYPTWVIGDCVSMMLPSALLMVGWAYPGLFLNHRLLMLLGGLLLAGAFLGATIGTGPNNRFESPATLLFPLIWLEFHAGRGARKIGFGIALAMLALLAVGAGERTSMVLWLAAGLAVYSLTWPLRRLLVTGLLAAVIALAIGSTVYQSAIRDALEQTRFRQNIDGTIDASLVSRVNEARDVAREFASAGVAQQLLGHGHGASFRPVESLTLQNISGEGYLHHVHIGPALILYRYGITGIVILIWVWSAVIRSLMRQRASDPPLGNLAESAFALALLMYLIDLLMRNVIADPAFSFIVAGFLFFESRRRAFEFKRGAVGQSVAHA